MLSLQHERGRLRSSAKPRDAFTLAETLLALTLAAVVLGTVTMVGTRLQHQMTAEAIRLKANEQLAAAGELLPLELRGVSPSMGDVAEATDSTVQYRATIGSAVLCGANGSAVTLAFFVGGGGRPLAPSVLVSDTLWVLTDSDSTGIWRPARIAGLRRATGSCSALDATAGSVVDIAHLWTADFRDSVGAAAGAIVRVTRPQRLSFYRASDEQWYLGLRSWNAALGQFNVVQPLSGPYTSPARTSGTRFKYYGDGGQSIPLGAGTARRIARVEALLAVDGDSLVVAIALRNR